MLISVHYVSSWFAMVFNGFQWLQCFMGLSLFVMFPHGFSWFSMVRHVLCLSVFTMFSMGFVVVMFHGFIIVCDGSSWLIVVFNG